MIAELFHRMSAWSFSLFLVILFLAALEFGYRVGLSRRGLWKGIDRSSGQHILTSMFALLGLILAFTYGSVVERFDANKKDFVLEASAIHAAFLHADMVMEPQRTELRQALLNYAHTRIDHEDTYRSQNRFEEIIHKSLQAQSKLWPITKQIVAQKPLGGSFLLVYAVDQVISLHKIRLAANLDRLPIMVMIMMLFVTAASLSVAGFNSGISGRLNRWRMTVFALVLAGVVLVIHDFDQPVDGFIHIYPASMINTIHEMEAELAQ